MLKNSRATLLALVGVVILLLGIIFHQFVLENVLNPIALTIWLLLRISILSLDQSFYWGAGIVIAFIYTIYRLLQSQTLEQTIEISDPNPAVNSVEYWRTSILLSAHQAGDKSSLKKEMASLLVALYSPHRPDSASFQIYDDLAQGEIPLPPQIHTFLFPQEPAPNPIPFTENPLGAIQQWFQSARLSIQKWVRRRSGLEEAEYYQAIRLALDFMEDSLEMKNDDEPDSFSPG